jgi:hypothetical protein
LRSRQRQLGRRISLEALEDRCLLSVSPSFAWGGSFSWGRQPPPQAATGTTPTSLSLTLSPSTGTTVYGQALTATATITATGTPTGNVTFTVDGYKVKTVSVATAAAGVTLPAIDAATTPHSIGAYYSGDATFAGSVATAVSETVTQASDTLNLTTSASMTPVATPYGEPITLTATLTPTSPGGGNGNGIVEFLDGSTVIAQAFVQSFGTNQGEAVAVVSDLSISGSPHNLTASYLGDADYAPSATNPTTDPVSITIGKATTSIVMYGRPNPVATGSSAAFTAIVEPSYGTTGATPWQGAGQFDWAMPGQGGIGARPALPTGTVTFVVNGGAPVTETITVNGMAQLPATLFSTPGLYTVTATYSGDGNYAGSTQTYNENVGGVRSRTDVTVTPKPAAVGQDFTLSVTVAAGWNATSSNTPTGTVTLVDPSGTIVLAAGTLASESLAGGQATFTADFPTAGVYPLTVQYSGDANFAPGTETVFVRVGSPSSGGGGWGGGWGGGGWSGYGRARDGVFANW